MMFEMRERETAGGERVGMRLHPGTEGADIECQCTLPLNGVDECVDIEPSTTRPRLSL